MNTTHLPELLRQLCVVLTATSRQAGLPRGLQPVHVEVLRYLARCNRYSNTPAALAEYLQTTRGTVSQSIKVLERERLIQKSPDTQDKRVVRLTLLEAGSDLLAALGEEGALEAASVALPDDQREVLEAGIATLLEGMQRANDYRSFGVCGTCRFFRREPDGSARCGITAEALSEGDVSLICLEHEHAA